MAYNRRRKSKRDRFDDDDLEYERQIDHESESNRKICEVTKKVIWRTPSIAASIAKQMRYKLRDPFISHYLCEHCNGYHTGHQPGTVSGVIALVKFRKNNNPPKQWNPQRKLA